MRHLILAQLALGLLSSCVPAPATSPRQPGGPSAQPAASASASLRPVKPVPVSPLPASPDPGVQPGALLAVLPEGLSRIGIEAPTRFLYEQAKSIQLRVILFDRAGQALGLIDPLRLEWASSRSGDFSIDAGGKATALVADGYSEIRARIPDTAFEAVVTLNVVQLGGGGGPTSTPAPAKAAATLVIGFE